jgi:hypothetical protein
MWIGRESRIARRESCIGDFKAVYGIHPLVLAQIWEDLQSTAIPTARIDNTKKRSVRLKNFLRANHFLMRYPTERERKVQYQNTSKTVRKWCWYFVERVKALKEQKVGTTAGLHEETLNVDRISAI